MSKGLIQTHKVFLHGAGIHEEQVRQIINIFTGVNLTAAGSFLTECQLATVEIGWFLTQDKADTYLKTLIEAGADVTCVVCVEPGEIYMVEEGLESQKEKMGLMPEEPVFVLDLKEDDLSVEIGYTGFPSFDDDFDKKS